MQRNDMVKDYLDNSKRLFSGWKKKENHNGKVFVEDGIVNPEIYFSQNNRILFVLKEAYDNDSNGFSLTQFLNEEQDGIATMWKRVSEWSKLIISFVEGDKTVKVFQKHNDIRSYGNEYLRRIAVINVKKSDGKSNSDHQNLYDYAKRDKKELFEQLKNCDPTIVVCGNVGDLFREIISVGNEELVAKSQMDREHYVYHFNLNGHDVVVISYWHPANQFPDLLNYYGFANVCKVAFADK